MAIIVGGIGTSHVPAIGSAIAQGRQQDPDWKPFFDGYAAARAWVAAARPDVVVVLYNDHGLNFFLDKMPTFAIGAASRYPTADEGWGLPVVPPFPGDPDLSWHLIESLMAEDFDLTTCQEMLVDHAFIIPMQLLWPGDQRPVRTVPISINTVQHPLPSAARCLRLGEAIGRAIAAYPKDIRVLIVGTGGLSHQLEGERAGFINPSFDRLCLDRLVDDPASLTRYSIQEFVALGGSQGVEFLMWLAMRGALGDKVDVVHSQYHVPISNTAAGLMVLEPVDGAERPKARRA
jgi:protocatechuate 4,5-dioxygenase beta chain